MTAVARARPGSRSAVRGMVVRIAGFGLIPAFSLISTVVLLPLISGAFGGSGWSALALGQSIGAIASFVVSLTWPVTGGQLVATDTGEGRAALYEESVRSSLAMALLVVPPAVALALWITPGHPAATALFVVGSALNGFSASWYFAGTGQPRYLVRNEAVVRLAGYGVSIPVLLLGGPLWGYGLALVLSGVVMLVLNVATIRGTLRRPGRLLPRHPLRILRPYLPHTLSRTASSVFLFVGPTAVAVLAPGALAAYSAVDQLQKAAANALSVLPQAFISWVGVPDAAQRQHRARVLRVGVMVAAVPIGGGFAVLVNPVLGVLFTGQVRLGAVDALLAGAGLGIFGAAQCLAVLTLVPLGHGHRAFRGMLVGSLCAALALGVLVPWLGLRGALVSLIVFGAVQLVLFVGVRRQAPAAVRAPADGEPVAEPGGMP